MKPFAAAQCKRQMSKISAVQHDHFVLCVFGSLYEEHSSCILSRSLSTCRLWAANTAFHEAYICYQKHQLPIETGD